MITGVFVAEPDVERLLGAARDRWRIEERLQALALADPFDARNEHLPSRLLRPLQCVSSWNSIA